MERVTDDGRVARPGPGRRAATRLNQALVESGRTAPWVMTEREVREYWATRTEGATTNDPSDYAHKDPGIMDFVSSFWSPEISPSDSVLELGPNAGPNLNRLRELGYRDLRGIEINPSAVEHMATTFPELAATASITTGSFDRVLPTVADDSVDAVFTMAVLIHVHPAARSIFREMARIAARHICVIEMEHASNMYVYPRSYRRVFGRLGCCELRSVLITPESAPKVSRDYDGYVARLFAVLTD